MVSGDNYIVVRYDANFFTGWSVGVLRGGQSVESALPEADVLHHES